MLPSLRSYIKKTSIVKKKKKRVTVLSFHVHILAICFYENDKNRKREKDESSNLR